MVMIIVMELSQLIMVMIIVMALSLLKAFLVLNFYRSRDTTNFPSCLNTTKTLRFVFCLHIDQRKKVFFLYSNTRQNSYSINHLLNKVTTQWLDSDSVVTFDNRRHHSDLAFNGSVVIVNNSDYTVTAQSPCGHCVQVNDGIGILLCSN